MGKSKRNTFENYFKSIPGPGAYTIPEKIVEGPMYHIGLKTSFSSAEV
jgi:hypothetical protein